VSTWAKGVLYVDRGILVVNKHSGLVCQFNRTDEENESMQDFNGFVNDLKHAFELKDEPTPLHRLDKLTTGALAFALTPAHTRDLAQQFRSHSVEKSYLALVRGGPASFGERAGTIRGALYSSNGRVSVEPGKQWERRVIAETDWELLASSPLAPLSLVRLRPCTGFKHQLRIHTAKVLKTPILGDTFHANAKLSSKITDIVNVPEDFMYLHASRLSFFRYLPGGQNKRLRMTFGAPLPRYFVRLCDRVKIPLSADLIHGGLWVEGKRVPSGQTQDGKKSLRDFRTAEDLNEGSSGEDPGSMPNDLGLILQELGGRWVGPKSPNVRPLSDAN